MNLTWSNNILLEERSIDGPFLNSSKRQKLFRRKTVQVLQILQIFLYYEAEIILWLSCEELWNPFSFLVKRSKNILEVCNYYALKYVLGTEINSLKETVRKNLFMKLYIIIILVSSGIKISITAIKRMKPAIS